MDPINGLDTDNDCDDETAPCATIIHAIEEADPENTIILSSGEYSEAEIIITENLAIIGQGQDPLAMTSSIVHGDPDGPDAHRVFQITEATVSFCRLVVRDGSANGVGGGILNSGGNVTITLSTITENFATGAGAGLSNRGTANSQASLNLIKSTVSDNASTIAAGIENFTALNDVTLAIDRSIVSGNTATDLAGGIANVGNTGDLTATLTLVNSTVSGNTAAEGGGVYNLANEGTATANIASSTIFDNDAPVGAGITNEPGGSVTVGHSIVADDGNAPDCSGTITDDGFNIDEDGSCSTFTTVANFTLPELADNGGPTQTHALELNGDGTEAIDAGDTSCDLTTDQRGEGRPIDIVNVGVDDQPRCDIGAFELFD